MAELNGFPVEAQVVRQTSSIAGRWPAQTTLHRKTFARFAVLQLVSYMYSRGQKEQIGPPCRFPFDHATPFRALPGATKTAECSQMNRVLAGLGVWFVVAVIHWAITADPTCTAAQGSRSLPFGMSTALTGPAAALGQNMRAGVVVAFEECNRSGGIAGRRLELIVLDDRYEPTLTGPNVWRLIYQHRVLALIGNVGTPTAVAALPLVRESGTPFFGALTGAGVLRKRPPERYVINFRASYAQETAAMVDALLEHGGIRPEEIAFFTQRDAYGDAGFAGGVAALKRHGLRHTTEVLHVRYDRNTVAVENALADLLMWDRPVKAVIMVGAYKPCARFIRLARRYGVSAFFLNVSFVGGTALAHELGPDGEGVIVTQVVPHVASDLPIVRQYRRALRAHAPGLQPTFVSLEGYIVGRILIEALSRYRDAPTREGVIRALESLGQFDLGLGVPLTLGPEDHQACDAVWPTVIRDGKLVPFDWRDLASLRPWSSKSDDRANSRSTAERVTNIPAPPRPRYP